MIDYRMIDYRSYIQLYMILDIFTCVRNINVAYWAITCFNCLSAFLLSELSPVGRLSTLLLLFVSNIFSLEKVEKLFTFAVYVPYVTNLCHSTCCA